MVGIIIGSLFLIVLSFWNYNKLFPDGFNPLDVLNQMVNFINPTKSLEEAIITNLQDKFQSSSPEKKLLLEVINIIKSILITTLAYETIKSFRKYSRKL